MNEQLPSYYSERGFDGRLSRGRRPCLLVVDMSNGFTDPRSDLSCDVEVAVPAIARLLHAAREAGRPVVFTTLVFDEAGKLAASAFIEKVPALLALEPGCHATRIDERIGPRKGEPVVTKAFPSGFSGTPLAALLVALGCDELMIAGASTSGCVRSTVVDALQQGYRVVVPREALADRDPDAHRRTLLDLQSRYAEVLPLEEVVERLAGQPSVEPAR
jgi:nicotinamidase-related amidase